MVVYQPSKLIWWVKVAVKWQVFLLESDWIIVSMTEIDRVTRYVFSVTFSKWFLEGSDSELGYPIEKYHEVSKYIPGKITMVNNHFPKKLFLYVSFWNRLLALYWAKHLDMFKSCAIGLDESSHLKRVSSWPQRGRPVFLFCSLVKIQYRDIDLPWFTLIHV